MKSVFLGISFALIALLDGQSIAVGMPYFEQATRDYQLLGLVTSDVSFCVRPINYQRAIGWNNLYSSGTGVLLNDTVKDYRFQWLDTVLVKDRRSAGEDDSKLRYRLFQALPLAGILQYNGHHPYGWQDGLRIPNKGAQFYLSGGVEFYNRFFDIKLQPEALYAQNLSFENPPYRLRSIDMPDRFGTGSYQRLHLGQSHAYLHLGALDLGAGTENLFWGPAVKNAIILSNNSPGFKHLSLKTNRPIRTRFGNIEFSYVAGNLKRSGFYPYSTRPDAGKLWPYIQARDITIKPGNKQYDKLFNGYMAVFQPKWLPGLYLGATRILLNDTVYGKWAYMRIISKSPRFLDEYSPGVKIVNDNQLFSAFVRLVLPESHAEFYVEWGRDDFFWDLEDLITQPDWTSVYTLGFQKVYFLSPVRVTEYLKLSGEFTRLNPTFIGWSRGNHQWAGFYSHTAADATHEGQVLGSGIGPGSNMQSLRIDWVRGFRSRGLSLERVEYKVQMFYFEMDEWRINPPYKSDDSKLWVDWGVMYHEQRKFGHSLVQFKVHLMKTYNFNWWYLKDAPNEGFRFSGMNLWSINSELCLVHQF